MDNSGIRSSSVSKNDQRKFFQWAVKWFYTDHTEDEIIRPDVPEVTCLLQAMGFQLRECNHNDDDIGDFKSNNDCLKIIIECGTSKLRTVMELPNVNCQCPSQDNSKDASFWSVSGTGPMGSVENMNKVVETGSNLLPSLSKGMTNVVYDVTQKLFKLIKNIPDVNQNTDSNLNLSMMEKSMKLSTKNAHNYLVRRHSQSEFMASKCRSLDTLIQTDGAENQRKSLHSLPPANFPLSHDRSSDTDLRNSGKTTGTKLKNCQNNSLSATVGRSPIIAPVSKQPPALLRQKTFDMETENAETEVEPRPSPPKISSSPVHVPQLCTTLSQISLQSEGKDSTLLEMMVAARNNLEQALKMLIDGSQDSVFNMEVQDIFLKPSMPRSSSFKISPTGASRPASSCSLPIQSKIRSTGLQKPSVRRNVANSFRKTSDGSSPTTNVPTGRSLLQRRSIPTPSSYTRSAIPQLKIDTPRSGNSRGTSTIPSPRTIITAKRRVSPDIKGSQYQTSNQRLNSSLTASQSKLLCSSDKSQSNIGTSKLGLTGSTISKFGFIKKKS